MPPPLTLLIVGAGAIGSLLGARLAIAGHRVTLVGRPWFREAVAKHGLTLVLDDGPHTTHDLSVFSSVHAAAAAGQSYDVALFATKAYALPAALDELQQAMPAPPPVATFQNGVGSEEAAMDRLGAARVIAARITTPVEVLGEARIRAFSKGGIGVAPWNSQGADPAPLAQALAGAGFHVRQYGDARALVWSKLLLNLIGNATSAILAWPPQRLLADPRLYNLEVDAIEEARRVMRALDIPMVGLPGYPAHLQFPLLEALPRWLTRPLMVRLASSGRGGKMPSLFLGLEAGQRESEVEVLNGAVVRAGETLGIATPVNRALTQVVMGLARGERERDTFRHQPEALLAEVARLAHS